MLWCELTPTGENDREAHNRVVGVTVSASAQMTRHAAALIGEPLHRNPLCLSPGSQQPRAHNLFSRNESHTHSQGLTVGSKAETNLSLYYGNLSETHGALLQKQTGAGGETTRDESLTPGARCASPNRFSALLRAGQPIFRRWGRSKPGSLSHPSSV